MGEQKKGWKNGVHKGWHSLATDEGHIFIGQGLYPNGDGGVRRTSHIIIDAYLHRKKTEEFFFINYYLRRGTVITRDPECVEEISRLRKIITESPGLPRNLRKFVGRAFSAVDEGRVDYSNGRNRAN